MQATVASTTLTGVEAASVEVQADVSAGLPVFGIVGLPDTAVQEARDRVRASLRAAGFDFPNARVIVNLAPAPMRKHGTGFDLPIALAILCATGQMPAGTLKGVTAVGELGLDGSVRQVPGMIAHALSASRENRDLLGPADAADLIGVVPGLRFRAISSIAAVRAGLPECRPACTTGIPHAHSQQIDLADISGHAAAKRALEIAAAGGHHVLLIGPPGSGKTMLARAMCGILPWLTDAERLECALVHSVAGIDASAVLAGLRPFRAPHHSCSTAGLVGGGNPPRPGEISLAHNGVLFLDELPEFGPASLQALRQPLEEGVVTLVRAFGTVRYPARVTVVAAMNPCPCGYCGDPVRPCTCAPGSVSRYVGRVGGPLYDRMDVCIRVDRVDPGAILDGAGTGEVSSDVRDRVMTARETATACHHGALRSMLTVGARRLLEDAARRMSLSGRAVTRVVRVGRTIASLDAACRIEEEHVSEALGLRSWEPA